MPIPTGTLALIYWFHLLATVTWLGSLVSISSLVWPAVTRVLKPTDQLAVVEMIRKRLEPIVWFSVSVLLVTGLFQMSVNPHYNGFISTSGQWSLAILAKHALVGGLMVLSAIYTWDVLPSIRRELLRKEKIENRLLEKLRWRETVLLRASVILGFLILLATGFARAS